MWLYLHWSVAIRKVHIQLKSARNAKHTSIHLQQCDVGRSSLCFSKHKIKSKTSQQALSSVASLSVANNIAGTCKNFNLKCLFFFCTNTKEQWSDAKWKITNLPLNSPPRSPLSHPISKKMPQRHCCFTRRGHRHREHILILSGKLGPVEARVPDSKRKQNPREHTEVQVKHKELLQRDLQMHTKQESVVCIFLL